MPDFTNLTPQERQSHFQNLVAVARRDGKIAYEERVALTYAARKWGLSQADEDTVLANMGEIHFAPPADREARFHQLYDLVEMMIMDGELKKTEKELCHAFATRLGFGSGAVETIKQGILDGTRAGRNEDKIQADLLRRL